MIPAIGDQQINTSVGISNPFPGLRAFRYEESRLFFGREKQVAEVVKKLALNRFVAVVGTSGIGKSSFINCGLLPVLRDGYKTEYSSSWEFSVFTPGYSPLKNLTRALLTHGTAKTTKQDEVQEERNLLKAGGDPFRILKTFINNLQKGEKKNHLIYIDQFEELFRYSAQDKTKAERATFLQLITEVVRQRHVPVYVVITLRSDFVGDCSAHPEFTELINHSQFLIPRMTRNEKKKAVTGPVSVMGQKIEGELVDTILSDAGEEADSLPVMQHALMRTWDFWKKNAGDMDAIGLNHYSTVGGMDKALSVHANEVYDDLDDEQKRICEKLFKCVTEKNDEGRGVRRPTNVKDIAVIAGTGIPKVINVTDQFRKAGTTLLMPPAWVPLTEESMIDISHESLMRTWGTLSLWVEEEAESVKLYLRLAEAAEMHQLGKAGLWRPPDLHIALNWLESEQPGKTWGLRYHKAYERTMLFLEFSRKEYEKEQLRKEKLQKRRLVAARITAIVLGLGAVVAFLFFLYGEQQRREAEKQRLLAREQAEIARQESEKARKSQVKAMQEAERALENETKAKEQKRLAELATKNALVQKSLAEEAHQVALTEERKAYNLRLLSIAKSMAVKSVNLTDPEIKGLVAQQAYQFNKKHGGKANDPDIYDAMYYAVREMEDPAFNSLHGHTQNVRALTSAVSGKYIYSAGSDGRILRWDLNDGKREKKLVFETPGLIHKTLSLSPDKKLLVCGGDYPYLLVFDLSSPESEMKKLKTSTSETWFVGFTEDSQNIISAGNDNKVLYWDAGSPKELNISQAKINSLAISPEKEEVLIAKADGEISSIDFSGEVYEQKTFYKDSAGTGIVAVAFSKNGMLKAAGNEKGLVKVWEVQTGDLLASLTGHSARVNNIRFSNDGQKLATGSFDKTVRLWDLTRIYDPPVILKDHDDWVWSVGFSPDGKRLLAGCKDNQIRLWPANIQLMKDVLCDRIGRNMSIEEWERFVADDIEYEKTCESMHGDTAF